MIPWPPHTFRQANKLGEIRKKDPKLGAKRNTEEMYKPNHSTYTAERFLLLLLTASNIESHVIYIEPFSYIRTFHIGSKELRSIGHNNHLYLSATCKLKADLSFFFFSLSEHQHAILDIIFCMYDASLSHYGAVVTWAQRIYYAFT